MPPYRIVVTSDPDYSGTLTLGKHPDGELAVEDGLAFVDTEPLAQRLADCYPNVEYDGEAELKPDSDTDDTDEDDVDGELALDPTAYSVADLRDELAAESYDDAALEAALDAEKAGDDRTTAVEALEDALGRED